MERHVAFFRQSTGAWVREWRGPIPAPDLDPQLAGDARLAALNAWQQGVAPAGDDEVGLDVPRFDWPLGDFC